MKNEEKETKETNHQQADRGRTNVPGQNPKQDDSTTHDVHHDEKRENPMDHKQGAS